MAENNFHKTEKSKKAKKRPDIAVGRSIQSILDGSILTREAIVRLLPFILYVTFLAMIYIANTYYAEKTVRKIDKVTKQIKELRYEHVSAKSELMYYSKPSEVARLTEATGLKQSTTPPVKIYLKTGNKEKSGK